MAEACACPLSGCWPIACVPPQRHIVSCGFFQSGDMSVQPQNISSSAGLEGIGVSDIMSENLPIAVRTTAPFSIARQIHTARRVIIMKAIAGATIRSWLSVIAAIEEF